MSNSRACRDPAPANWGIALLLHESSFPHQNPADSSTTSSRSLLGVQEVIALSLVYFSSSTLLIHSATTGVTGTTQCAGIFSVAPMLKYTIFEKEKIYWQPSPYIPLMLSYLRVMPLPPYMTFAQRNRNGVARKSFQNHITIPHRKMTIRQFSLTTPPPLTPACMPFFFLGKRLDSVAWQPMRFPKVPVQVLNFWVILNLVTFAG